MRKLVLLFIVLGLIVVSCSKKSAEPEENSPAVLISPSSYSAVVGEVFDIEIALRYVEDLVGVGVRLNFDSEKLEVVELGREDDFLTSNSGAVNQLTFTSDNDEGYVKLVLGILPASASVSDMSGNARGIGKITFRALSPGTAELLLSVDNASDSDLGLYNSSAELIPDVETESGNITISSGR
ncbi:hypothetical protein J7K18_03280 [bacterium]|nr:hypothetical protein [bacterium]